MRSAAEAWAGSRAASRARRCRTGILARAKPFAWTEQLRSSLFYAADRRLPCSGDKYRRAPPPLRTNAGDEEAFPMTLQHDTGVLAAHQFDGGGIPFVRVSWRGTARLRLGIRICGRQQTRQRPNRRAQGELTARAGRCSAVDVQAPSRMIRRIVASKASRSRMRVRCSRSLPSAMRILRSAMGGGRSAAVSYRGHDAPHHRRPRGGRIGWVLLSYGLGIRSTLLMVQSRSARTQRAPARSGRRTRPILAAQLQRTGSAIKAAGAHVTRRCGHPPPRCAAAHRRYPIHPLCGAEYVRFDRVRRWPT
jgi:hypothetical protein